MKKLIVAAATASLAASAAPVHAHEISSREEYNRILRNAERFSENITPSVDRDVNGNELYEWIGDGFSLIKRTWAGGELGKSQLCVKETDTRRTCWSENGWKWGEHLDNRFGRMQWFNDGGDGISTPWTYLRKRWPGEPAPQKPDLFK
jgi:hypothetical protein